MEQQENRDDLIRRVIEHREQGERRLTTAKEKEEIAKWIKKEVMPQVYEDK